ncbi:MAG: DUF6279 family lipoprotein, partial [Pseudomonadales bacterium]
MALCCVVVFASGCSVKFMYNNADRFARWSVSDYIDMDAAQRDYFDEEFGAIMYWHRSEELPRYASYLESLETVLGDDAEPEDVQGVMDTLFSWWDRFEARSINMVTEMLLSLSDEQVEKLPLRLADDNAELSEDEHDQPLEDIQESWWQGYSDTLSRFSGRLTKDQKGYLAAQSVRYVPQFDLWADYRRRWQGDLLVLLHEKRGDPEVFAGEFLELLAQRESYYGEELAAVFDSNEKLARDVTAWLINDFDDKQRERFFNRIGEMAAAFR